MKLTDLHWLAGLLEGEGSFYLGESSTPSIVVTMTDLEPVRKASILMGSKSVTSSTVTSAGKRVYRTSLSRAKKVRKLLLLLMPLMSPRRQGQIERLISRCNKMEDDYISGFQKAELVTYLVKVKGVSQAELSRRTGISDSVIHNVIAGKTKRMGSYGAYWNA